MNQEKPTPRTNRQEKLITRGKPTTWVCSWWAEELEREADAHLQRIAELEAKLDAALDALKAYQKWNELEGNARDSWDDNLRARKTRGEALNRARYLTIQVLSGKP